MIGSVCYYRYIYDGEIQIFTLLICNVCTTVLETEKIVLIINYSLHSIQSLHYRFIRVIVNYHLLLLFINYSVIQMSQFVVVVTFFVFLLTGFFNPKCHWSHYESFTWYRIGRLTRPDGHRRLIFAVDIRVHSYKPTWWACKNSPLRIEFRWNFYARLSVVGPCVRWLIPCIIMAANTVPDRKGNMNRSYVSASVH